MIQSTARRESVKTFPTTQYAAVIPATYMAQATIQTAMPTGCGSVTDMDQAGLSPAVIPMKAQSRTPAAAAQRPLRITSSIVSSTVSSNALERSRVSNRSDQMAWKWRGLFLTRRAPIVKRRVSRRYIHDIPKSVPLSDGPSTDRTGLSIMATDGYSPATSVSTTDESVTIVSTKPESAATDSETDPSAGMVPRAFT